MTWALVSEDETITGRAPASLGEIVVEVDEVAINGITPWLSPTGTALPPLNIHERAKKGIVHGTQ